MSIYNFDTELFGKQFLPPLNRFTRHISWIKTLLTPIQYLRDLLFDDYADGSSASDFNVLTTYTVGNKVKYTDKAIYELYTLATAGTLPTDTDYWRKIQDSFIGVRDRSRYNAQTVVYEKALNTWFGTTWSITPGASDIYITNNLVDSSSFFAGINNIDSSYVAIDDSESLDYVGLGTSLFTTYAFTIHLPTAVYTALGSSVEERDAQVMSFADKIKLSGTLYNIITY